MQGPKKKGPPSTAKDKPGKRSWKDKLTILQGTATGGMQKPQSADVHLVAYGLGKDTTAEQLASWLQSNGLEMRNGFLLTKYLPYH